jgi:hypothetical protein
MKKVVIIVLFALLGSSATAQGIRYLSEGLAVPDGASGARIEVVEEGDAAHAIEAFDRTARIEKVDGYRVSLFRDNKQTSGEDARAVMAQFKEKFPGIAVAVSYESPYFKVTAGNFIDRVDAIALQGKALPFFNKAFVILEKDMPVADIIEQSKTLDAAIPTTEEDATEQLTPLE